MDDINPTLDDLHSSMVSDSAPEGAQNIETGDDQALMPLDNLPDVQRQTPIARPDDEASDAEKKEVAEWWRLTGDTEDISRLHRQLERDTATVYGEDLGSRDINEQEATEDRAKVTNRHVYRNAVQSMALIMPTSVTVKIEPQRQMPAFDLGTGIQKPDSDGISPQHVAFAYALDLAQQQLCEECNASANLRGFVQDAHHYEVAWLHVTWQRNYRTDSRNAARLNDAQDQVAELEVLTEAYDKEEFDDTDAQYKRMTDLMESVGKETELPVWEGVVVKSHPAHMVRKDPKIKRIEDWPESEWISVDYMVSRKEILKRHRRVKPDDLQGATTYGADGKRQGNDAREMNGIASQQPEGAINWLGSAASKGKTRNDWDTLLLRIVESKASQRVYVLVEGLPYYADSYTPEDRPAQWYEIQPFVLNRPPGNLRMEGLSDSELQAKEQDRINRIDTDEDEDSRAGRPRGIYDKDVVEDWNGKGISELGSNEWLGVSFGGKNMAEAFLPIPGQNINPGVHTIRRQTAMSNLRSMSGIPEQMTGAVGNPKFAEQVKVSDKGAAVLMQLRSTLCNEALSNAWRRICHCIVVNASVDFMVMLIGENVRKIWAEVPKERLSILRRLSIKVNPSMTGKIGPSETIDGLRLLSEIDAAPPGQMDKEKLMEATARAIELPIDIDQIIKPNPNDLAMRLGALMAKDPSSIDPVILRQLAQVLMPRIQQDIQQATQTGQHAQSPPPAGGPSGPVAPAQVAPPAV